MTRGRCLGLVVVGLLSANAAYAQVARSQFNGTVTDSAGGVLVGATVIATNVETNVASKTTTTEAGVYVLPYLANGLYRIRVEATGFRPAQSEQITLRAAQTLTLDFKLNVDALTEAVTVTAPVIETSTAERNEVKKVARELLDKLKNKLLVLNWRQKAKKQSHNCSAQSNDVRENPMMEVDENQDNDCRKEH